MAMKNVTLSIDEPTLKAARQYAAKHGKSLNQLVRDLVADLVDDHRRSISSWLDLVDETPHSKFGRDWKRDDLYE